MSTDPGLNRRDVLIGMTVVAAGTALKVEGAEPREPRPVDNAPTTLGTLKVGAQIGRWRVVDIRPVKDGAVPVTMEVEGHRFELEVMRRDDNGPTPPGRSGTCAVFLANNGEGRQPTPEIEGLGAMALADQLARMEAAGEALPRLLTFNERLAQGGKGPGRKSP